MTSLKNYLVFIFAFVLLVASFPASVSADPVSAGFALASAMDAYGMAYGVGTVYDVSNQAGVSTSFSGLWDEFSLYQSNNGDNYDYSSFYDNFDSQPSVQAFSHSSGKFAAWVIDDESAEVFDRFWNWLLTGPAEMQIVDNNFSWSVDSNTGDLVTPSVYSSHYYTFNGYQVSELPLHIIRSSQEWQYRANPNFSGSYWTYATIYNGSYSFIAFTLDSNQYKTVQYRYRSLPNGSFTSWSDASWPSNYDAPYRYTTISMNDVVSFNCPFYEISSPSAYKPSQVLGINSDTVPVQNNDDISVKPYGDTSDLISLPVVTDENYIPQPIEIVTNVPWDEDIDDTDEDENGLPIPFPPSAVSPVIDDMIDSIIDDGFAITDDPQPDPEPEPSPGEVFLPFLPISYPSFNFSFTGIWHYVREWVASLGTWFSLVFTVWGILPYAIVVPVYATAVVVIVLGVYKRFFM